jgi:hypothetical protein
MRPMRSSGQSELDSDGAGANQHTPILKPYRIPYEHLGRTTLLLIGVNLIPKRVSEALFFSSPFLQIKPPIRLPFLSSRPHNPHHDGIGWIRHIPPPVMPVTPDTSIAFITSQ